MPVSLQNDFKALETKADNQAENERIRTICLCEDEPMFLYLTRRQRLCALRSAGRIV